MFQLREPTVSYNLDFGAKNRDIGGESGCFRNENTDILFTGSLH